MIQTITFVFRVKDILSYESSLWSEVRVRTVLKATTHTDACVYSFGTSRAPCAKAAPFGAHNQWLQTRHKVLQSVSNVCVKSKLQTLRIRLQLFAPRGSSSGAPVYCPIDKGPTGQQKKFLLIINGHMHPRPSTYHEGKLSKDLTMSEVTGESMTRFASENSYSCPDDTIGPKY